MINMFNNKYVDQVALTKDKLLKEVVFFSEKKNNEIVNLAL